MTRGLNGPRDVGQAFTLIFETRGVSKMPLSPLLLDAQTQTPIANPSTKGSQGSYRADGSVEAKVFRLPLEQVGAVEVSIAR